MPVTNSWQINGANPVTVGGVGVAAKYFTAPSGNFTSGVSTTPSATNATGQLAVHGDNQFNGQLFDIVAAGDYTVGAGGACPNVTIEMVANTGTLVTPTYTVIASTDLVSAQNNVGLAYPWFMKATVNGTTASGTLQGVQLDVADNVVVALEALDNTLTGLDFSTGAAKLNSNTTGAPVFGLVMRITFSVSEPGNSANLYQFQVQN